MNINGENGDLPDFRRIVTGHDESGASMVRNDISPVAVHRFGGAGGPLFHEIWRTGLSGSDAEAAVESYENDRLVFAPASGGTLLRIVDVLPEKEEITAGVETFLSDAFAGAGAEDALTAHGEGARHYTMHRTATIDYGIVLAGEITLILDREEMIVRTGDVIVQRGTNHGWANRSDRPCRIAFILVDAEGIFPSTAPQPQSENRDKNDC